METEEEKKARLAKEAAEKEAADAAAKAAAAAAKAEPFAVFETAEAFQKRVAQATRSALKDAGLTITDPAKLKEIVDAHAKAEAEKAAAAEAQKSEIQKAAEAAAAAKAAAEAAMSEAESAKMQAHLYKVFAEHGVKNFDYAFYKTSSALAALKDGEELDEVEFVKTMMADKAQAAALGLEGPPPKVEGATTTVQGNAPDPKTPPAGGGQTQQKDAFQQTSEEFKTGVAAKYGFTPF